jgi:hypothetical protein
MLLGKLLEWMADGRPMVISNSGKALERPETATERSKAFCRLQLNRIARRLETDFSFKSWSTRPFFHLSRRANAERFPALKGVFRKPGLASWGKAFAFKS